MWGTQGSWVAGIGIGAYFRIFKCSLGKHGWKGKFKQKSKVRDLGGRVSYIEGIADKEPIIRPCMTCCRQGCSTDWSIIGGDKPWGRQSVAWIMMGLLGLVENCDHHNETNTGQVSHRGKIWFNLSF